MTQEEFNNLKEGSIIYTTGGQPAEVVSMSDNLSKSTVVLRDCHGVHHKETKECVMHDFTITLPITPSNPEFKRETAVYRLEVEQATNGFILAEKMPFEDNELLVSLDDKKLKAQLADKIFERLYEFLNSSLANRAEILIDFTSMPSSYTKID